MIMINDFCEIRCVSDFVETGINEDCAEDETHGEGKVFIGEKIFYCIHWLRRSQTEFGNEDFNAVMSKRRFDLHELIYRITGGFLVIPAAVENIHFSESLLCHRIR